MSIYGSCMKVINVTLDDSLVGGGAGVNQRWRWLVSDCQMVDRYHGRHSKDIQAMAKWPKIHIPTQIYC